MSTIATARQRGQIERLRKAIADLQAERLALEQAGLSRQEAEALAREWAAQAAEDGEAMLRSIAVRAQGGNSSHALIDEAIHLRGAANPRIRAGSLVVMALGVDTFMDRLRPHLAALPEAPSREAKAERLVAIAEELDRLESEEERLICQAEAEGHQIGRRGDARPDIVIAPEPAQ